MGTLPKLFLQCPVATRTSTNIQLANPIFFPREVDWKNSGKTQHKIKFFSAHDLKPAQLLNFDLPWIDPADQSRLDVVIIGTGPAGLRLAEQVSRYGIKVCCIDTSPLSMWPNNYGVWVDEFEKLGLEDYLHKTWPVASVHIDDDNTKYLGRPYGCVDRNKLKKKLIENCISNGVRFHKAQVWKVEHEEFESSVVCDDGNEVKASLVVDASGFTSTFIQYDKPRNHGYQIAYGILAEVENHPFDLDKMVLMDWRDTHLRNEPYLRASNSKFPTFLYAMPFDSNFVFLKETSLVSRPILSYVEVKRRMIARLRYLGITVKKVLEDEKCLIPMGGPLPIIPQNVMAFGRSSGLVHPLVGYMVAQSLAFASPVADAIVECLGSTWMIRGKPLYHKVWDSLWPVERRHIRDLYCVGMETLLKLDLAGSRRFFDAFLNLDPDYQHGLLSSTLSLRELALLSFSLFKRASIPSKLDIVTKLLCL